MTPEPSLSWDPEPHERLYYRHAVTGDRGWLVRRDGKDVIRMDRPHEELRTFREHEWKRDTETRPLTVYQVGQIAFAADRALAAALGNHQVARKGWMDITDDQRRQWVMAGPLEEPRKTLRDGIIELLRPLME